MKRITLVFSVFFATAFVVWDVGPMAQNTAKQARAILKKFRSEPTIREVHRVAQNYALVNRDRIVGLMGRARFAGWLPEFRFLYQRNVNDGRNTVFPTANTPILTTQAARLDHRFAFRAAWQLDELIFNRNELAVYRELKRLIDLRVDVLKETTKLYYERRRLQVDLLVNPPKTLLRRVRVMLRMQELTADLDAFTGGYFSRSLKRLGKDPYR